MFRTQFAGRRPVGGRDLRGRACPMSDLPRVVRLASLALGHDVSTSLPNAVTSVDSSAVPNLQISNLGAFVGI